MPSSQGTSANIQGRLLWVLGNSLWKGNPKVDDRNKQPVIDQKTGLQVIEYGFGLAIPKSTLTQDQIRIGGTGEWYAKAMAEIQSIYPNGMPKDFAYKWKDGDTDVDNDGELYSKREGYAGCMVLSCITRIPVKVFSYNGAYKEISEGVNAGDYVQVNVNIKAHTAEGTSKAGMYYNPSLVLLVQKGNPIVSAVKNPESAFGQMAPVAAPWMIPATTQAAPENFGQFAAAQAPAAPVAPHYGVLPQVHQPQAPAAPVAPAMPGGFPMAPQAPVAPAPQQVTQQPMGGFPMPGGFPTFGQ